MKIIYKVYEHRIKAGLTIVQLAELSGVSKSQINRIENGQTEPTVLVVALLADALGVSASDLFEIKY